jgi:hypothetical protein
VTGNLALHALAFGIIFSLSAYFQAAILHRKGVCIWDHWSGKTGRQPNPAEHGPRYV